MICSVRGILVIYFLEVFFWLKLRKIAELAENKKRILFIASKKNNEHYKIPKNFRLTLLIFKGQNISAYFASTLIKKASTLLGLLRNLKTPLHLNLKIWQNCQLACQLFAIKNCEGQVTTVDIDIFLTFPWKSLRIRITELHHLDPLELAAK